MLNTHAATRRATGSRNEEQRFSLGMRVARLCCRDKRIEV
jgi:hypothetical protein